MEVAKNKKTYKGGAVMEVKEVVKKHKKELVDWMKLVFKSRSIFTKDFPEVVREKALQPFWAVCFQMENEKEEKISEFLKSSSTEELLERLVDSLLDIVLEKFGVREDLEEAKLTKEEMVDVIKAWLFLSIVMFLQLWGIASLMGPQDLDRFSGILENVRKNIEGIGEEKNQIKH